MEHTLALIVRAHQGDKEARETLFEENTGLIYSVAKRFLGRGVEMEDLFQIGSIGLLKAVDKFDLKFEVRFSTYAVPMIAGEIKRFLRDDGIVKVSRSLKESQYKVSQVRERLESLHGREPTIIELSEEVKIPVEELVMILDSKIETESLHKVIYQGDGNEISLMDRLSEKEDPHEIMLNRIFLEEIFEKLDTEERKLIRMRFFQERTQTEIAGELGISQVQVSRMEKKILKKMRDSL